MKSKTTASFLLVGVFLVGVLSGAVGLSLYRADVEASPPPKQSRGSGTQSITEKIAAALSMEDAQKEQLEGIIARSRERYKSLSRQFSPHYDAIRLETDQEIREILREDQKAKFEDFIREMEIRRKNKDSRKH